MIKIIDTAKSLEYKVFEGLDHYNNKPLYRLVGINNDHVGDWIKTKEGAINEIYKIT